MWEVDNDDIDDDDDDDDDDDEDEDGFVIVDFNGAMLSFSAG